MKEALRSLRKYQATLQQLASVTLNREARVRASRPNDTPEEIDVGETIPIEVQVNTVGGEEPGYDDEMATLLTSVMQNYPIEGLENEIVITVNKLLGGPDEETNKEKSSPN